MSFLRWLWRTYLTSSTYWACVSLVGFVLYYVDGRETGALVVAWGGFVLLLITRYREDR